MFTPSRFSCPSSPDWPAHYVDMCVVSLPHPQGRDEGRGHGYLAFLTWEPHQALGEATHYCTWLLSLDRQVNIQLTPSSNPCQLQ